MHAGIGKKLGIGYETPSNAMLMKKTKHNEEEDGGGYG